jgi:SSS family transporter
MHFLIDGVIIVLYLAACIWIALLYSGKNDSTDEYFTAGGRMSNFFGIILVGLSIAATLFSGISFIAQPSLVYSTGIIFPVFAIIICMPISYLVLRYWFLPRYLSSGSAFPYDVVERRFGGGTRTIASVLFICMRVGWMAAMIYAPTLAVLAMGNLSDAWFWPVVLITGLSCTFYTVFSGIRGVIITDAMQMIVIIIGIAATIVFAFWNIPVSFSQAMTDLREAGKFDLWNFSLNPTHGMTFFTIVIGVSVANLANYLGDQMSLQRYLATGNVQAAGKSFLVNAVGVIIVIALLAGIGLTLYVYYMHVNDPKLPTAADKIFPYFVAHQLPMGLSGLLLAALLAATMSSMASGINALAGVVTLDFRARFGASLSQEEGIRYAKYASLIIGVVSTLAAGLVSFLGKGLFDLTQVILGVFAGPLLACVAMSVSKIRVNGKGMQVGLLAGSGIGVAAVFVKIAVLWIAPLAALTTAVVAYVISRFEQSQEATPSPGIPGEGGGEGSPSNGAQLISEKHPHPDPLP